MTNRPGIAVRGLGTVAAVSARNHDLPVTTTPVKARPCAGMSGASEEGVGARGLPAAGKACLSSLDRKLSTLNEKVDKLLHFQEDVTEKLQGMCRGLDHLEQGLHRLEASRAPGPTGAGPAPLGDLAPPGDPVPPGDAQVGWPEVLDLVQAVRQDAARQGARLESLFRVVVAVDRALALVGAVFQNSKVVDFILQASASWRRGRLAPRPTEVGDRVPAPGPGWRGRTGLVGRPARWRLSGELRAFVPSCF